MSQVAHGGKSWYEHADWHFLRALFLHASTGVATRRSLVKWTQLSLKYIFLKYSCFSLFLQIVFWTSLSRLKKCVGLGQKRRNPWWARVKVFRGGIIYIPHCSTLCLCYMLRLLSIFSLKTPQYFFLIKSWCSSSQALCTSNKACFLPGNLEACWDHADGCVFSLQCWPMTLQVGSVNMLQSFPCHLSNNKANQIT